mmetsp:Transcript_17904/g.40600  ORF Transcript_17904/g.40600 Transcript_17904/m.40600 type:complete len:233 (+) Transcript_17904:125-823(+)
MQRCVHVAVLELEDFDDLGVQLNLARLWEEGVADLLDGRVLEDVTRFPSVAAWSDKLVVPQDIQVALDGSLILRGVDLDQQEEVELPSDHARNLERQLLRGRQPVDPAGDQPLNRVGDGEVREVNFAQLAADVLSARTERLTQGESKLRAEQRAPLRSFPDQILDGERKLVNAEDLHNELHTIVVGHGLHDEAGAGLLEVLELRRLGRRNRSGKKDYVERWDDLGDDGYQGP